MFVISHGIHKRLVRKANREDPDQTASEEGVLSGSALYVEAVLPGNKCLEFWNIYGSR